MNRLKIISYGRCMAARTGPSRRALLTGTALGLAAVRLPRADAPGPTAVGALPTGTTRTWLAPEYWANRLQDWRLSAGRIECVAAGPGLRTVGVLPLWTRAGAASGALEVRTGTLAQASGGFSGFLIGTGAGVLHWKAAALVGAASGTGGGLLAVYDADGVVRFRDHTDETDPFAYAVVPSGVRSGSPVPRSPSEDVTLRLALVPGSAGGTDLELSATATRTGRLLSRTVRTGVADAEVVGGVSLVSAATGTGDTRHWFTGLSSSGSKVTSQGRRNGPVLGTLYSLSGSVLKLSAQLAPIGTADPQGVVLQVAPPGSAAWTTVQRVTVGDGCCALFRVEGWDGTRDHAYRVGWAVGTAQESWYGGTVRREPDGGRPLSIAMLNCTGHTARPFDRASEWRSRYPGEGPRGLYTPSNVYFPYAETAGNLLAADPDVLVALGDQYYEGVPTDRDEAHPGLDQLGRYALWLWSFGDLTRDRPTLVLVDDHDVFQGNLWGWAGRPAPGGADAAGGYREPAAWVNTVQRRECCHNPDPYDPTPVLQGITVYYAAFSYGGVSFALLEDRKWKNTNKTMTEGGQPLPADRELLGARQESFLSAWASMHRGQPKICLTQTLLGCLQTDPDGLLRTDTDSNGVPVDKRDRAVGLLKAAGALVLSGDQHLGSLVRHGLTTYTDGPVQFTAPATGTTFQRWFEPSQPLPNAHGAFTGDVTDAYGNRMRVLAVANPRISFAQVHAVQARPYVGDRGLKREGYGLVEVDRQARRYTLHCWPWQYGPTAPGPGEYAGWPYVLPFDAV